MSPFPELPIITPSAEDRMSMTEKYGSLFYLGLIGLLVLIGLIGWFVYGIAANWSMWTNIYILHDTNRPDEQRILAADRLASDPRVNQRQYWDMVIRPELPSLARYRLAEALTAESTASDPAAYAKSVAFSTGWPDWLRVLMLRPMAYAVNRGISFSQEPIRDLQLMPDPFIKVWATYVQALQNGGDPVALKNLTEIAQGEGEPAGVARLLDASLHSVEPGRTHHLDEASRKLRKAMPEAASLWSGWEGRIGR